MGCLKPFKGFNDSLSFFHFALSIHRGKLVQLLLVQLLTGGVGGEQAFAGDVVHLEPDAVGILEQNRIVTGRPFTTFGRTHDLRTKLAHEFVNRVNVLACTRAEAYVMQPGAILCEPRVAMLFCASR